MFISILAFLGFAVVIGLCGILLRIRRLFSYPDGSIRSDKRIRKNIRRIYFRPVTYFARIAKVEWDVKTGYWNNSYVDNYLFPTVLSLSPDKAFDLSYYDAIQYADCLVDFGVIYPFRLYLKDGRVVDYIKEREALQKLPPKKLIGYSELLSNMTTFCISISFFLSVVCLLLLFLMVNTWHYRGYGYWVVLIAFDLLLIFRPWLLFMPKKPVYSMKDLRKSTGLTSSKLESNDAVDLLFFKDSSGLASSGNYVEPKHPSLIMDIIVYFAICGNLIALSSLFLLNVAFYAAVMQIGLSVVAWCFLIKGLRINED